MSKVIQKVAKRREKGAKLEPKRAKKGPKGETRGPKSILGALGRPFGDQGGLLHFF